MKHYTRFAKLQAVKRWFPGIQCSTRGSSAISSWDVCAPPGLELRHIRSAVNFATLAPKRTCISCSSLPRRPPRFEPNTHKEPCYRQRSDRPMYNIQSIQKIGVIKLDMIFIWYGNVYTYASWSINYSYCLFFFPVCLWYTLCILFWRQTHLWTSKKKAVKRKKGRISWRLSLWLQKSEGGKTSLWERVTGSVTPGDRETHGMRICLPFL